MNAAPTRLLAIGLDAAEPSLIERWMDGGRLPALAALRGQGAWGGLRGPSHHRAETPWSMFLSGLSPERSGYWGDLRLDDRSGRIEEVGADDFDRIPPFYALGPGYRVAIFDVPKTRVVGGVDGIQLVAWGAHAPGADKSSQPPGLMREIEHRYGPHPALHRDDGEWWDRRYLQRLRERLLTGIRRRGDIVSDLLAREPWDLLLTVFGETHSAGHDFWHLGDRDHPLSGCRLPGAGSAQDPLLEIYEAVDRVVGELVASLSPDTAVCVFSLHGSGPNSTDVPSMAVLPELLFRSAFPGRRFFADTQGAPISPPLTSGLHRSWTEVIWRLRQDPQPLRGALRRRLPLRLHDGFDRLFGSGIPPGPASPNRLRASGDPLFWQPASWFRPFWPNMRAFALPSYSEGMVRINLAGRDPQGTVDQGDYDRECREVEELIRGLRCARTGRPAVDDVLRTRDKGRGDDRGPGADLVIRWCDRAMDTWEHPHLGSIGPLPFRRTGSHREQGFVLLRAPGVRPASQLRNGSIVDLPPTLLQLLGVPNSPRLEGTSLLRPLPAEDPS